MRNNRYWDLLVVAGWAITSMFLVQLALPAWAKAALVVPWVLGLLGYAVTAAIFPNRRLGKAERLMFVIVLSCAVSALGGPILNLTAAGLRRDNWLIYFSVVTLGACVVAFLRRLVGPVASSTTTVPGLRISRNVLAQGGLFACAGLIALVAIVMARIPPAPAEGLQGYTLLWMLPPNTGRNTDAQTARVGLHSVEFAPTQYRLKVQQAGLLIQEWTLQLQPGERWESEAIAIPNQANAQVIALLYRTDVPTVVYRQVAYWPNKPTSNQTFEAK